MASREKKPVIKREEPQKNEILQRLKAHPFLFSGTVLILIIVVVAFVFVPAIVPSAQRGKDLIFGYYNKIPIKYVPGNYFYQAQNSIAQQQGLSREDPNYINRLGQVWREAFNQTAVHLGILDEMKEAGYIAPEVVVDRAVADLDFLKENGKFSSAKYRAMDNNARMNLWRQIQESIIIGSYQSDFDSIKVSSKEAAFIAGMASPRRTFDTAVFPMSSYPDSEVISYAKANPNLFKQTKLSRITVNSGEKEARQILNKVKDGVSTFEETARTSSQDIYADRGGDMGIMMAFELRFEISDDQARESVINLAGGELSDIIKVTNGWAFFRAEESARPADLNDETQKLKIRNYIMENVRGQAEDWLMAEADKFIERARESSFDEAIYAENITKRHFGPISVNYGNAPIFASLASSGVPELTSAGSNQLLWETAFSTPLKTISKPLVVGDNVLVLLPLEQSYADENDTGFIEMYYPYWVGESMNLAIRNRFLHSGKLEDNFTKTFLGLWSGN